MLFNLISHTEKTKNEAIYIQKHSNQTKRLFDVILLKYFLSKIKSYVQDDFFFLKKCKRNLTKSSRIVTFDVMALYTNMLHELGFKTIEYWLDKYLKFIHSRFNNAFILEALKLVLKKNYFVFNEHFFLSNCRNCYGYYCCSNVCNISNGVH